MTGRRPPGRVTLLWCPTCGATRLTADRELDSRRPIGVHVGQMGGTCTTRWETQEYVIPRAPEPLPGLDHGAIRAAVAVEVAFRPGLAHLDDGPLTFVGRTVQYRADDVEQLAELAGLVLRDIAAGLPDAIAVHPRPEPEGWMP